MPKKPRSTADDLLIYIYEKGHVRAKDLEQAFVQTKRMSRGTMYKYKRLLEQRGKIESHPVYTRPLHYVYSVPEQHHYEAELLKQYRLFSQHTFANIKDINWEDPPQGFYLTDVKQKVLWNNETTGAMAVLNKAPVGIAEPVHIHPHANEWGFGLSGEIETVEGKRVLMKGTFSFVTKGARSGVGRVTEELLVLLYWDGPRTKIAV